MLFRIFDEVEDGKYNYNDKTYDVILEIEGKSIKEDRKNLGCHNCENNIYAREVNKYVIEKENFDHFMKKIKLKLNNLLKKKIIILRYVKKINHHLNQKII